MSVLTDTKGAYVFQLNGRTAARVDVMSGRHRRRHNGD